MNTPQYSSGLTPLHLAAQLGHGLTIELLLNNEADPTVTDGNGHTPVHVAAVYESVDGGLGAFVRGVKGVRDVLEVRDINGLTPLMHAAAAGSEHNVKYLLRKKVTNHFLYQTTPTPCTKPHPLPLVPILKCAVRV